MGMVMETTRANLVTAANFTRRPETEFFGTMGEAFYTENIHTVAIKTMETEIGSIIQPVPVTVKAYRPIQIDPQTFNCNGYMETTIPPASAPPVLEVEMPIACGAPTFTTVVDEQGSKDAKPLIARPPKKKWIKEYLEEEPKSVVPVRLAGVAVTCANGAERPPSPAPPAPAPAPAPAPPEPSVPLHDFVQEHSRPRATNNHGPPQIPSPPSTGSSGSGSCNGAPRAGTREVHNKLEKNRRAHLKECFELLKRQLPSTPDDKKTSNLSILGSAIRYIQVLRRKERECEHEMEKLAREKIAAQQRLANLKRDLPLQVIMRPRIAVPDAASSEKERDGSMNGQVIGIPVSITSSPPRLTSVESQSRPQVLNTSLRTLPIQITPTSAQVLRTTYGTRHNTLTLTTLTTAESTAQNIHENGVTNALSSLVHPTQIHLPISQVGAGLVVGGALQLLPARVLHTTVANGVTTDTNRLSKENGIVSSAPHSTEGGGGGGVVVGALAPLVLAPGHRPHAHKAQLAGLGGPVVVVSSPSLPPRS